MNIKINDEAVWAVAAEVAKRKMGGSLSGFVPDAQKMLIESELSFTREVLEVAADILPRFTYTEEDLVSLARGVVPEWLRFDADAALDEELAK